MDLLPMIAFYWFLAMVVGTEIYINMPCQAVHSTWLSAHAANSAMKLLFWLCTYCAALFVEVSFVMDALSQFHLIRPLAAEHVPILVVVLGIVMCLVVEYRARRGISFNWKKQFQVHAAIRQLEEEDDRLYRLGGVAVDYGRPSPFSTAYHFKCKECGARCRTYSAESSERELCGDTSCHARARTVTFVEVVMRRAAA